MEPVRKFIADKRIAFVKGAWLGSTPMTPWWRVMNQSGRQLIEQATHTVGLARYLLGDVKEVYAMSYSGLLKEHIPNYDVYEVTVLMIKFLNGTIDEITCTCLLNEAGNRGHTLKLFGKDLEIDISVGESKARIYEKGVTHEFYHKSDAFLSENEIFIEAVKTKDPSQIKCDFYDGYKTFLVTYFANQSILKNEPISISL